MVLPLHRYRWTNGGERCKQFAAYRRFIVPSFPTPTFQIAPIAAPVRPFPSGGLARHAAAGTWSSMNWLIFSLMSKAWSSAEVSSKRVDLDVVIGNAGCWFLVLGFS